MAMMAIKPDRPMAFVRPLARPPDANPARWQARDKAIKFAMDQCRATGRKFEDATFPAMCGRAAGRRQDAVYRQGMATSGMPLVTQWLRPEEFCNLDDPRYPDAGPTPRQPMLFKSMWEVEGIIQGAAMDNRWLISALNIVSANRGQMDRIFFGEVDPTWVTYGFFVCKFYRDDPRSDDDWCAPAPQAVGPQAVARTLAQALSRIALSRIALSHTSPSLARRPLARIARSHASPSHAAAYAYACACVRAWCVQASDHRGRSHSVR